ncbi:MAG: TIGR02757 family protein [Spirochaetaceae bacterium]|nr:TIGR02757 family protein [Spirochaetaceae bacterium]
MSASHSPVCAERDEVRHVPEKTARKLRELAERYETASFSDGDPSFILKRYKAVADVECSAFVAAVLAFGRRDQFLPKIERIFAEADRHGGPEKWLKSGSYASFGAVDCRGTGGNGDSPRSGAGSHAKSSAEKKFYRFYSYSDMICLFARLAEILEKYGTLGNCIRQLYGRGRPECAALDAAQAAHTPAERLLFALESAFSGCHVVPQGKTSAAKRLCMFLRWMIRRDSPVDTGLWSWAQPKDLIIPLDTHVLQESVKMGLLPEKAGATLKNALTLTSELKEIWPDDPCKGDFALFGLGVDEN